jgi:2-hydroxy-6-oxonona-2,4-dienedioate hydrolase
MDEPRYRAAERALWDDAGATPMEHRVHLRRNEVEVRVQEVGDGAPVLFIHGGPGAAGSIWAYLVAQLPGLRCLLVDRPGTGLSDPQLLEDPAAVRREAATLVADVFDGLDIDRGHLVGSSHGSYVALLSAAADPDRVERTVHLGCPGFIEDMAVTAFDRLVLFPGAHQVFGRLPTSEGSFRKTLRQLGHEADATAARIPQPFVDCSLALHRHTDTMRNELASMANMGSFRGGFDPSLTVDGETLGMVRSPSYFLWGDNDPYGSEGVARGVVTAMPEAELEMLPGGGHLCWFDDVARAADAIRTHLLA